MSATTSPTVYTRPHPQAEQVSPITSTSSHPSSNTTPTRSHHLQASGSGGNGLSQDYPSPSAYLNHDAYAHDPATPHGSMPAPLHDMGTFDMSQPHISPLDEYGLSYQDYNAVAAAGYAVDSGVGVSETADHATPSASHPIEDDRTPVVSGDQAPIPSSSLPAPPMVQPLMSPFRQFGNPSMVPYQSPTHPHPAYIDPSTAFYPTSYADISPLDTNPTPLVPMPPHFAIPIIPGQPFPGQFPPPHGYDFGPARSRGPSPTSSISSSAASLARSGSTSSELRPPRPKVKLTYEDKRNIVELHRQNSSLRQEDIAKQYGVDRSTISKIILAAHRWTQPQEPPQPVAPKANKSVGGRFPAIEAKMHEWMDTQIAQGLDVRDNIARDKAKAFAKEIGFPLERFKASAKWLDKFKDRRKAAGKPTASPMHIDYGYYPYTTAPYQMMSPLGTTPPVMLSRSQSAATLSSSDSSGQEAFQPSPSYPPIDMNTPARLVAAKSETDLLHIDMTPGRQRSQSSPQVIEPAYMSPSSGKASRFARPAPLNLTRQNSYHGTSPSPRRPVPLSRANSSQPGMRRSRPTSLAASAFGITPITSGDEMYSPLHSPSTSSGSGGAGTHSRQRSDVSLGFTSSMGGMTISPDMSDSGEPSMVHHMPMTVPPLTPVTPNHVTGGPGVFAAQVDFEIPADMGGMPPHTQYATMPNKHYGPPPPHSAPYIAYPQTDFGPVYGHDQAWS